MATKIIKAWIDGSIQEIEVEEMTSPEQPLSYEDRLGELEDKPVITDGNLLVGNGTEELEEMTPEEVLSHINGASVATMTTEEYEELEESNANTLYVLTDSDDRPDWSQTDETADDYIKNKPDVSSMVEDLNARIDETNESILQFSATDDGFGNVVLLFEKPVFEKPVKLINFYIEGNEFSIQDGATWSEFVSSNPTILCQVCGTYADFYIIDDEICIYGNSDDCGCSGCGAGEYMYVYLDEDWEQGGIIAISANETIFENINYSIEGWGG